MTTHPRPDLVPVYVRVTHYDAHGNRTEYQLRTQLRGRRRRRGQERGRGQKKKGAMNGQE